MIEYKYICRNAGYIQFNAQLIVKKNDSFYDGKKKKTFFMIMNVAITRKPIRLRAMYIYS